MLQTFSNTSSIHGGSALANLSKNTKHLVKLRTRFKRKAERHWWIPAFAGMTEKQFSKYKDWLKDAGNCSADKAVTSEQRSVLKVHEQQSEETMPSDGQLTSLSKEFVW